MKAQFVFENIRFERGASDDDLKRELRAQGPIQPGEIIVRDFKTNPHIKELDVYVQYNPEGYLAPHKVYSFGHIDRATDKASFIHNTQNLTGQGSIQDGSFRRATREEAAEIRKALQSGRYDRYIEEAKKKTGLTPFV